MEPIESLLGRNGFLPHGYCFSWTPGLLWSMVGADAVIALAYFSIPLAIVHFVRQRGAGRLQFGWVPWLFSAFIFACGITHLLDIWTIWRPDYGLQALGKVVTAGISAATALALWPLIPRALKIPSVGQLQRAITALEAEVAKRRSAEEHAQDVEQTLAVTLASIEAGYITADREGRVLHMNAVAEAVTGWTLAQARGQPLLEVFVREDRPPEVAQRNPVDLLLERGISAADVHEGIGVSRDGTRRLLEMRAAPTRGEDGSVRGLALVFRDMTRLDRAETAMHRLAAIVESSHDAIIGKTLDGRITSWNQAAESMFGWTAEEAIGQPVQMLMPVERRAEEMRILAELTQGRQVDPFDTVRQAKDGRRLEVSVAISPIRDASGRIVGASKIARDVSQQRRAEAALRRAQRLEAENREIQAASRMKSQFLANMSHELRTPLNAVIGFADLLRSGAVPPGSPKHDSFLGHIASSGHHLLQLINDVLDLSKVESGKFEFFPEPVDLARLVREVVDVLHGDAQRKHLRLSMDIAPGLHDLRLDPARLKQVLFNYLSNAIKFTGEGGLVQVRASAEGPAYFRVEVEDSGIGIALEDQARLFVEFQQLDTGYSKRHQGTGLGLALTRRLAQAQGGTVGLRSTPGAGSVFHVVLPRAPQVRLVAAETALDPAGAAVTAGSDAPGAAPVHRVLVIDGDTGLHGVLADGLDGSALRIEGISSGARAVQLAVAQRYDALTLGLRLPDQPGLGALGNIRSGGASRGSPVLGLTLGLTLDSGAGHTAAFAIADVLAKPLRSDELLAAMTRLRRQDGPLARVLVIDDDPIARDLMQATLQASGLTAVCVGDALQALLDIEAHRPDAIVLDLMMPGMDGFETLQALSQMPRWRDTPVLVWTSLLLSDEEVARLTRSARAIVGKGGGALQSLLQRLREWAPQVAALPPGGMS